jgi:predicted DsbA family dithiol-disulfide isomerase
MGVIEVYADIWCPFAHVGLRAVVRRRDELGRGEVALRVRAWPLELVNGLPMDPRKTAEHIRDLRAQVAPGLFIGFDPARFPTTTLPALALVTAAYELGEGTGEAVSLALRDALFEEGRDISDPVVLSFLANAHGVGPSSAADGEVVLAEWRQGEARGVKGSPHFFCGAADAFCPTLDIAKDEAGHLQLHRNVAVLNEFLASCFAEVA